MEYQALYRKYRSQTFEEIVGQEHIVRTLQNALNSNKIAHAYLFTGPRGTGKTSMARLFAKALNCEEGFGHICNHCDNCKSITEGNHPDIVELDAASNSRVEEIRNIIDRVNFAPIKGKYKVYIIDEVHMLSNSAFNALLKTLEEPPENVVFILATTEPHKVLPTIVSRCQRFDFTRISDDDLEKEINYVSANEGFIVEEKAKKLIISLADGGVRDCLSILDQLYAYCGNEIKYDDILKVFGLIQTSELVDFLYNLIQKNTNIVLNKLYDYNDFGINIKSLTENIILALKDTLIIKTTNNPSILTLLDEDEAKQIAEICSIDNINYLISEFIKCQNEFKNTANIKSFFEIAILKLSSSNVESQIKIEEKVIFEEDKNIKNNVEPKIDVVIKQTPLSEKNETKQIGNEKPIQIKEEKEKYVEPRLVINLDPDKIIAYSDEILIKAITKSTKDKKQLIINQWHKLNDLLIEKEYKDLIPMLKNVAIFTFCDELLIVQTQFPSILNSINNKDNKEKVTKIIEYISGIPNINVYAINYSDSSRLQKRYMDLRQVGKLPSLEQGESIFND